MKKLFAIAFLIILSGYAATAQQYPRSVYFSTSGRARSAAEVEIMQRLYDSQRNSRILEQRRQMVESLYRTPSVTVDQTSNELMNRAKKFIEPNAAIQNKHKDFLKLFGTGMVNLLPPSLCAEKAVDKKESLSDMIERCPSSFIRGHGQYFSFRRKEYVDYRMADIGFLEDIFFSTGSLTQGIFVNLGDVKLEDISPMTKGVEYLATFMPAPDAEGAAKESDQFEAGLDVDGFSYRKFIKVSKDQTYALRIIAYRPYYFPPSSKKKREVEKTYLMPEDARMDVLVVFRVIEKSEDGTLTLLWKELRHTQSPELMIPPNVLIES